MRWIKKLVAIAVLGGIGGALGMFAAAIMLWLVPVFADNPDDIQTTIMVSATILLGALLGAIAGSFVGKKPPMPTQTSL